MLNPKTAVAPPGLVARASARVGGSAFRWAVAVAIASGLGSAAPEAPIVDAATAKAFNTSLKGQNLRQTAEQTKDDVVVRRGVGVGDPVGETAYSLGGATPEASELREKTCAADLIVVARRSPSTARHFQKTDRLFSRFADSMWRAS
jgi:hypothetical protein